MGGETKNTNENTTNTFSKDIDVSSSGLDWQPNTNHTVKIWLTNNNNVNSATLTYNIFWAGDNGDTSNIKTLKFYSNSGNLFADVKAGSNLSEAIDKVDGFTKKLSSSVMVGEETGALESMLVSTANQMEYDSEIALNKLVSYLEPTMIVFMAVIVGFIIISVIQPIYGSYAQISQSYQ